MYLKNLLKLESKRPFLWYLRVAPLRLCKDSNLNFEEPK
jgi:hypothetical protein